MAVRSQKWDVTPTEAIEIQKNLAQNVEIKPFNNPIHFIAGADISFDKDSPYIYAGIVVLTYPEMEVVEEQAIKTVTQFPNVPGLLSFREIPALLMVWGKLKNKPQVVIVDGHGIAHPRRLGIASHFGLATGVATIGCAKKLITGAYDLHLLEKTHTAPIVDRKNDEILGRAILSKKRSRPLFISPGHNINLTSSVDIVERSLRRHKLPEPTRYAHLLVNKIRRGEISEVDYN